MTKQAEETLDAIGRDLVVMKGRDMMIGGAKSVRGLRTEAIGGFDARIERLNAQTYRVTVLQGRRRYPVIIEA